MMWCYCYHLHSNLNFARIQSKKIISITPFVNYVLPTSQRIRLLELLQSYEFTSDWQELIVYKMQKGIPTP